MPFSRNSREPEIVLISPVSVLGNSKKAHLTITIIRLSRRGYSLTESAVRYPSLRMITYSRFVVGQRAPRPGKIPSVRKISGFAA